MNETRTTGIVLRTYPLTESSLIVHWLTADFGRLATAARGARGAKSPFRGKLDLFFQAELTFARSRRSDLHTLREVSVQNAHENLRHNLSCLQQACYCAALVEQTTETDTPMPRLFGLFTSLLAHLAAQRPLPQTVFAFELKLLGELGLAPAHSDMNLSAGTAQLLRSLADSDWLMVGKLRLSQEQVAELGRFLHGFLIYHLGKHPANRGNCLGL